MKLIHLICKNTLCSVETFEYPTELIFVTVHYQTKKGHYIESMGDAPVTVVNDETWNTVGFEDTTGSRYVYGFPKDKIPYITKIEIEYAEVKRDRAMLRAWETCMNTEYAYYNAISLPRTTH